MNTVIVGTGPVSFADVVAVARDGAAVALSAEAEAAIAAGREVIDALAHDTAPHYGVSTGFGALATRHIPAELRLQRQRSLVRSHDEHYHGHRRRVYAARDWRFSRGNVTPSSAGPCSVPPRWPFLTAAWSLWTSPTAVPWQKR